MRPQHPEELRRVLDGRVPTPALDPLVSLVTEQPVVLRLSNDRKSKLGDFRPAFREVKFDRISINRGLNPYAFLITLVHEVAHQRVWAEYGRKVHPHGSEWKHTFQTLMEPYTDDTIFPEDVLIAVAHHFNAPKASSCSDVNLQRVLSRYDALPAGVPLEQLDLGKAFEFRGRQFVKGETRRTRIACSEPASGRKFTFHPLTPVQVESPENKGE